MIAASASHYDISCRQLNSLPIQRRSLLETPPDTACPTEASNEIGNAATALCQPDLEWQEAAAIIEVCIRELWTPELDAVSLFPEVRHILEHQLPVQQLLDHVRNGCGSPEDNLQLACYRLIRSAAALHQIRSHAVTGQSDD